MARNGFPEPEVIVNYADGHSYSKGKLEDAMRLILDKPPVKSPKPATNFKKEDVDFIVAELEVPRGQAEKVLTEHEGDVLQALRALIAA